MVLRTEAVRARLLKVEEVIGHLLTLRELSQAEVEGDFRNGWALERGLQLGAEALFDVGNHVLSAAFGTAATDYEDILRQLGHRGVIDSALAARLRGLGGFRNILVHAYLDLDSEQVYERLRHAPEDFSAFVAALREWLEARSNQE
jgi:uncharacterized protein YutE (UPF0331/DUF86 family)